MLETALSIKVVRMFCFNEDRSLKAFADITVNDVLLVKGVMVIEGRKGLFVSMPREQSKDQKWYDSVRCLSKELQEQITEEVLQAFHDELN